jgi:hypothetical protein
VDVANLLDELDRRAAERVDRPLTSGRPKRVLGIAARMSVDSSNSRPPPMQSPFTAAMIGFE